MPQIPANFVMPALLALCGLLLVVLFTHFYRTSRMRRIMNVQREHIIRLEAEAEASDRYGDTFKDAARASVMAVGQELSSKLLEDHKREAEAVKQSIGQKTEEQQQKFLKQFGELSNAVAAINETSKQTQDKADTLWRTMSSPGTAGQLTEVSLENLLLNLGLQRGTDFDLQASMTNDAGSNFRPDGIVYLPFDRLMIIDCKASKYELELAAAETEQERTQAEAKFSQAMHKHITSLAQKNYTAAVIDDHKRRTGNAPHPQIINVMYIASDAAVSRLDTIDGSFREKMQKYGIIAVGPAGLHGLCSIASMQISELKRDENREKIVKEIERILAGLAINLDHLEKTGTHLKRAAESYTKFTSSYNRTLSPRLKNIEKLGISPEGNKKLPGKLLGFEMRETNEWIEGEAEDADNVTSLEDKRKSTS
ncbi:MAG: DNA recombination protein RmuC [Rickettsiales bacterium]|nr:DNA recombination protein RmuC [Rickettsiales bacterium]